MNRDQLREIVSMYQEDTDDLFTESDGSTTITVYNHNITAVFIGDELDAGLVHEVLNHVIGKDYDDAEEDIFRVTVPDTMADDIEEKINVMSNAASLTATAEINGVSIELYSMFVVGSRRSIKIMNDTSVDNICRFETWTIPEIRQDDIPDIVANHLADVKHLTPDNFRNIELLNGDHIEVSSCIEYAEKEEGKLFCMLDLENKICIFGFDYYHRTKGTLEPCLEFRSRW